MAKQEHADNLRNMPTEELLEKIETFKQEIWHTRQKVRLGTEQQVHTIGQMKRNIARIKTVLREKKNAE